MLGLSLIIYLLKKKKNKRQEGSFCKNFSLFPVRRKQYEYFICMNVRFLFSVFIGRFTLDTEQIPSKESQQEDLELPLIDLLVIEKATNNFSVNNILGEGGFGPVYKVKLSGL